MPISNLYNKIYSDESTKDSKVFIDIFETNQTLFDNLNLNGNHELHNKVMRLTADYAHHLTLRKNYKKALPVIDRAIELFQSYKKFKDTDLYKIGFYETLVFDRVKSNYYLKNFNEVKQDLEILTSKFPDNDKYRNWLAFAKLSTTQKLINVL